MNKQAALNELKQIEGRAKALRAIIDEPEKLVFEVGDLVIRRQGSASFPAVLVEHYGGILLQNVNTVSYANENPSIFTKVGHIDDLKLYGEDCKSYKTKSKWGNGVEVSLLGLDVRLNHFESSSTPEDRIFSPDNAIAFANKIKQIAYTAKRKASK